MFIYCIIQKYFIDSISETDTWESGDFNSHSRIDPPPYNAPPEYGNMSDLGQFEDERNDPFDTTNIFNTNRSLSSTQLSPMRGEYAPSTTSNLLLSTNDLNSKLESMTLSESNTRMDGQFIADLEKSLNITKTVSNGDIPLLEPPPSVSKSKRNSEVSPNHYSLNGLYANTYEGTKNINALNDTTNVVHRIWNETALGNGNSINSTINRNSTLNNSIRNNQGDTIKLDDLRVSENSNIYMLWFISG